MTLAILGYTSDITLAGMKQLVENNKQDIEKFVYTKIGAYIKMKDGTRIIKISFDKFFEAFPLLQYCFFNFPSSTIMTFPSNLLSLHIPIKTFFLICLKIPFIKNNPEQAILCLEIDYSMIFYKTNFIIPKKFEFGKYTFKKATYQLI